MRCEIHKLLTQGRNSTWQSNFSYISKSSLKKKSHPAHSFANIKYTLFINVLIYLISLIKMKLMNIHEFPHFMVLERMKKMRNMKEKIYEMLFKIKKVLIFCTIYIIHYMKLF